MGDLRACSPEPKVAFVEEKPSSSSLLSSNQTEYWQKAEAVTEEIIAKVQPTLVSEERRKAVIDYVKRLIKNSIGFEVFPFGSVPLKTYLPDGDIDLTVFGGINCEEALANDVCSVLEYEDQNRSAEFVVKDVQLIRAEVKLVKCLVQNIVVDISFNRLGGLSTLCFLEQVDHLIGKDHLFKRSIILIKAWCYYESRILGAHHGLISTYALETLVLYIFHLFHSTLNGPLAVLYKFLDYFSKFDWDNYCISLNGPVRISSLPEVLVEKPVNSNDLLLSNDFLKDCVEMFSLPVKGFETSSRTFYPKHLNIIDPLREYNNLGRSVSKGNFYRIRSAFTYGARKLGCILCQPDQIVVEICNFFSNTLDRHGCGQRPDVQDHTVLDGQCRFYPIMPSSGREPCQEDHRLSESNYSSRKAGEAILEDEKLSNIDANVKLSGRELSSSKIAAGAQNSAKGLAVSEKRFSDDAKDLATSRTQGPLISNDALKSSAPAAAEIISPKGRVFHAPHLYFSSSFKGIEDEQNENSEQKQSDRSGIVTKIVSSGIGPCPSEGRNPAIYNDPDQNHLNSSCEVGSPVGSVHSPLFPNLAACSFEDLQPDESNIWAAGTSGSSKALNSLADLSGDCESHLNNLRGGQWLYEYGCNAHLPLMPPALLTQYQSKNPWDVIRRSVQFRQYLIPEVNVNGVMPRPLLYQMNSPVLHAAFGIEEMPKPRGTGTYFPDMNHYKDRPSTPRGRNSAPRSPRNNARNAAAKETNLQERNSRELSQSQLHNQAQTASLIHPTVQQTKPVLARDQHRTAERSYKLKDEDDFPPLSDPSVKLSPCMVKKLEMTED
ncbi:hypothetical protein K2173_008167 [Erythroxylum novogranatense]|uniref:PAP/OAS1 substrate-binding domain superfamily n=1 Tax=Erythroxylum novogranatense TaxID=1862640 RepID=A0AAV8UBG6_9ROSI|nr:hypothetical protein K2173_008167 [Erythroxylum novogranatense]